MINTKYIAQFIADDSFEKFKQEIKVCFLNKTLYESKTVKWFKDTWSLCLFILITKFIKFDSRVLLIEKIIKQITTEDYIEFENIFNNFKVFKLYRSYQKHYDNCGIPFSSMYKFIHTRPNDIKGVIEHSDTVSYQIFNEYAIQHSNKFISLLIYKYIWKVLSNEYR